MSGPKAFRIVTRAEIISICRRSLARLDAAIEFWTSTCKRNGTIDQSDTRRAETRVRGSVRGAHRATVRRTRSRRDLAERRSLALGFLRLEGRCSRTTLGMLSRPSGSCSPRTAMANTASGDVRRSLLLVLPSTPRQTRRDLNGFDG